jgi:DNA helicase IV
VELALKKEARKNLSSTETKSAEEVTTSQTEEVKLEKIQKEIDDLKSRLRDLKRLKELESKSEGTGAVMLNEAEIQESIVLRKKL